MCVCRSRGNSHNWAYCKFHVRNNSALFVLYFLPSQRPHIHQIITVCSPLFANMLNCSHSKLKLTMRWPISGERGWCWWRPWIKIPATCDMQSRTSPFPHSFFLSPLYLLGFDRNPNQLQWADALLSDRSRVCSRLTHLHAPTRASQQCWVYLEWECWEPNSTKPEGHYLWAFSTLTKMPHTFNNSSYQYENQLAEMIFNCFCILWCYYIIIPWRQTF